MPLIRPATAADIPAIAEIYNHAIRESVATMDTVDKSADDRRRWLQEHGTTHPVLVCESEGRIVGWADVHPWSDRIAYQTTVEGSVFLAPGSTGKGYGPTLLKALLSAARDAGFHSVVARIAVENQISINMCKQAGFREVGIMREAGFKFNRWIDIAVLECLL